MGQGVSSAASKTLAVVWILFSLTFLFVLLRLYIRIKITPNSRWGKDDYYYFASFVSLFRAKPQDQPITAPEPLLVRDNQR